MKRRILLILTLLILCGCGTQPADRDLPTESTKSPNNLSTEPTGYYAPDRIVETAAGGAVQIYPLEEPYAVGILPMGKDLLLFTEAETTTLTLLTGSSLSVSASSTLNCSIYPEDTAVQVHDKGITYYDSENPSLVFLDTRLQEVNRIVLPDTISGQPALSADRKLLYYCTGDAVRCIDLETKLDRLLKQMSYVYFSVVDLHCDDTVIEFYAEDRNGSWSSLFISAETGETLYETGNSLSVFTWGDTYFSTRYDADYLELLTGTLGEDPLQLKIDQVDASVEPVLEIGGVIHISIPTGEDSTILDFYDLTAGTRSSSVEIPGGYYPWCVKPDHTGAYVWFLCYNETYDCDAIYRWDLEKTGTNDTTVYLGERHTLDSPNLDGLTACQKMADSLSEKHGVDVLVWTDATAYQPWDYSLHPEYQVPLIKHNLAVLDQVLSCYPEGFLETAASGTTSGDLRICLVRAIVGNPDAGVLDTATGLQYWDDDGNAYISLTMGSAMRQTLFHELFHLIESKVMSSCSAYDNWKDLNPQGFEYDYDYVKNMDRDDHHWTEGDQQAFIDLYSMSYPKEDRARIMEYAMLPGNEHLFESDTMQKKLKQLCLGIREAFELETVTDTFLWEQYLNEPINANT